MMCSRLPVSRFLWQLLPARNWPFTPVEERLFVDDLAAACAAPPAVGDVSEFGGFGRGDATALLNSLRCGLSWDGLVGFVPGVDPRRLLAAYRALDKARAVSVAAFEQLLAEPPPVGSSDGLTAAAARVVPAATGRVVAAWNASSEQAAAVVSELREMCAVVAGLVDAAEQHLQNPDVGPVAKVRSGRDLYDPFRSGLWSHPLFIPDRVGSLVPVRAASLLASFPASNQTV